MLHWDDLRFFLSVHRARSLSAAGRTLRVDQATVGRRVRGLEKSLGVRLFDRTPDGYAPTPAGETLVGHAERVEAEALAAERELSGREAQVAGTVRVSTTIAFAQSFLIARLARLRERHPDVLLEVIAENREVSLTHREADIALRLSRPTQPLLVTRRLGMVGTALFASGAYLAARGRPGPDLAGHDLIHYDESFQPAAETGWLAAHARGARTVIKLTTSPGMLAACRAGMGIALLPAYSALGVRELERLDPPGIVVERGLWLVVHRDLRHAARVRAVCDFVAEVVEKEAKLLGTGRR